MVYINNNYITLQTISNLVYVQRRAYNKNNVDSTTRWVSPDANLEKKYYRSVLLVIYSIGFRQGSIEEILIRLIGFETH
jgi:hypothetical protein